MPLLDHIDIVNAACVMVGEEPLQSLDDEIDAGQSAALLYDAVLEFNLQQGNFSFAKQIRQLSRDDLAAKLAGYAYVFDLPAERIGDPVYVTDDPTDPDKRFSRYAIVDSKVHADPEKLYAMIRYRAAPVRWSGPFKLVMITSLAAQFAISLCHDRALSEDKKREAYGPPQDNYRGGLMRTALSAEAFTQPPRPQAMDDNPLTRAWLS